MSFKILLRYGKGRVEAFHKLQLNILRVSDDDSSLVYDPFKDVKNDRVHGALAHSPTQFQHGRDLEQDLLTETGLPT